MGSIATYFYLLHFFLLCWVLPDLLPEMGALARESDTRNRLSFSPPMEGHKGQPCHHPTIMIGLVVVLFHVSFLVRLFVSRYQLAEGKILSETVFSVKDQNLTSLSFIALIFFLSRICLCWRITTGDLQSACFENQGFLLTCQRKWRKWRRDETYWCPHVGDKLLSLGHAWDSRVDGREPAGCASCLYLVVGQRRLSVSYSSRESTSLPALWTGLG